MNKKFNRRQTIVHDEDESPLSAERDMLQNIHQKLDNSPALNGGFDRLLYKIDGIEKSQVQIVEKVDKIHEAIYNPDEGLFARLAASKASNAESLSKVEKDIVELEIWKNQISEDGESCEKEADQLQEKIFRIEKSLDDVEKFQKVTYSVAKWLAAAIGGGIITFIAEALYKIR